MEAATLGDFVFIYEKFATAENKSIRTIEGVTAAVRQFDRFLGGCTDVSQVGAEDLRQYIRMLQEKNRWSGHPTIRSRTDKLSPHSIASYTRSIRTFWSWLKREEFIDENPLEKVKPPKAPRRIIKTFTNEQITQLLKAIPRKDHDGYRDYTMVITLYGTGLRISELLDLKMDQVNLDTGQFRVMGKGSKERAVYMSANVYKVLAKYAYQWRPKVVSEYFFLSRRGQPLSRFYVEHRFSAHGKRAGIIGVRCSPHTLRHSFAVNYLRNGGDTFTLQRILGHATLEMTRHYTEVTDSDVEIKQKAFSPAEKLALTI